MISFKGKHFMKLIILIAIRWYVAYALSYRDIEEISHEINKKMPESGKIKIRQNKYLNNMIEQDHGFIKKITRSILGFKAMHSARATLDGTELHHMLRKEQHINFKNQSVVEQFYALAA